MRSLLLNKLAVSSTIEAIFRQPLSSDYHNDKFLKREANTLMNKLKKNKTIS